MNEFCYCVLQLSILPGARTLVLKRARGGVLVRNFVGVFEQERVYVKYYILWTFA